MIYIEKDIKQAVTEAETAYFLSLEPDELEDEDCGLENELYDLDKSRDVGEITTLEHKALEKRIFDDYDRGTLVPTYDAYPTRYPIKADIPF